ncbi:radical SAM family heme chaperone HemW [bacterium]|nr:radical SAM family heme chaperone HemW [bacterium]
MPLSLYFHLPYCRRKCPYCDFYKSVPREGETSRFIGTLAKEVLLTRQQLTWAEMDPIRSIYFGGGTPSLHSSAEIGQILARVSDLWSISPEAEITLEANPGTLENKDFEDLLKIGVNRLSIGVQSFTNRKLSLLYRDHSIADSRQCVDFAQRAGFANISLDLIFGLPAETIEEWRHDINNALELAPQHVSLYNLEYHEGTPLDRWRKAGKWLPLGSDLEAELYLLTNNLLTAAGFQHYEVSNFAREGFRAVHNAVYWKGEPCLSFGPSAFSFDGDRNRHANVADIKRYRELVEAGELPIDRRWTNNDQEQAEEWISGCLRQSAGIAKSVAETRIGKTLTDRLWTAAAGLPESHRELNNLSFRLTPKGWFVENEILGFLFDRIHK